ncbi:hypothetical protein FBQ95_16950 [Chloroflexi bacterium CFX3]|nr:hypothetical protein [Chloroflexi bacterium CFX3]
MNDQQGSPKEQDVFKITAPVLIRTDDEATYGLSAYREDGERLTTDQWEAVADALRGAPLRLSAWEISGVLWLSCMLTWGVNVWRQDIGDYCPRPCVIAVGWWGSRMHYAFAISDWHRVCQAFYDRDQDQAIKTATSFLADCLLEASGQPKRGIWRHE